MKIRKEVDRGLRKNFSIKGYETSMIGTKFCVLALDELKWKILNEAHSFAYAMHLKSTEMYHILREIY